MTYAIDVASDASGGSANTKSFPSWPRFPAIALGNNPIIGRAVATMVWLAVPIELYNLSKLSGGYGALIRERPGYFIAALVVVLLSIVSLLVISMLCAWFGALFDFKREKRMDWGRCRVWLTALVATWAAATTLTPLAIAFAAWTKLGDPIGLLGLAIYASAALVGAIILSLVVRWLAGRGQPGAPSEQGKEARRDPNLVLATLLVTLVIWGTRTLTEMSPPLFKFIHG